ncbi:unnamed protein product, partial [Staurois parvus]
GTSGSRGLNGTLAVESGLAQLPPSFPGTSGSRGLNGTLAVESGLAQLPPSFLGTSGSRGLNRGITGRYTPGTPWGGSSKGSLGVY